MMGLGVISAVLDGRFGYVGSQFGAVDWLIGGAVRKFRNRLGASRQCGELSGGNRLGAAARTLTAKGCFRPDLLFDVVLRVDGRRFEDLPPRAVNACVLRPRSHASL